MKRPGKDEDSENVPPGGRAFQRIQQDRTARGLEKLPEPAFVRGVLTSEAVERVQIAKRPAKSRGPRSIGEYAKADKAKARLMPTEFAANVQRPVWRSLGAHLIPRGQTYGAGGNNKP